MSSEVINKVKDKYTICGMVKNETTLGGIVKHVCGKAKDHKDDRHVCIHCITGWYNDLGTRKETA